MLEILLRCSVLIAAVQQAIFPYFVNPFAAGARPVQALVPSQLEPAGYAFSIWGPIYLLAMIYGTWQLTPAGRADGATLRIAPFAIVLYLGSSVWLCAAKYGPVTATAPILAVMAACAILSLLIAVDHSKRSGLGQGYRIWHFSRPPRGYGAGVLRAPADWRPQPRKGEGDLAAGQTRFPWGLRWWAVVLPFALYAGWTLCATFVNFAEVMPPAGFNRFGLTAAGYALLSLGVSAALAVFLVWRTDGNLPFAATIIWALVAIGVAGLQRGADHLVVVASFAGAGAIAVLAAYLRLLPRSMRQS